MPAVSGVAHLLGGCPGLFLQPGEQALFRRLSVLAGDSTLEAAMALGDVVPRLALAGVSSLVDKSLVLLAHGDVPRYGMLDVIRAYARELLEDSGELEEVARRHADYYRALAEQAEPELTGGGQRAWYERTTLEHENVREALRTGDAEVAVGIGAAGWQFWRSYGYFSEGRAWLAQALGLDPHADMRARAKALWGAGWLAFQQEDLDEAERLSAELASLAQEAIDARTR